MERKLNSDVDVDSLTNHDNSDFFSGKHQTVNHLCNQGLPPLKLWFNCHTWSTGHSAQNTDYDIGVFCCSVKE
jgi:hypothetical protein